MEIKIELDEQHWMLCKALSVQEWVEFSAMKDAKGRDDVVGQAMKFHNDFLIEYDLAFQPTIPHLMDMMKKWIGANFLAQLEVSWTSLETTTSCRMYPVETSEESN